MKEKVMQGKPYAGNPHVRFDEGAGASRHSGRSALLYRSALEIGFILLVAMGSTTGHAELWDSVKKTSSRDVGTSTRGTVIITPSIVPTALPDSPTVKRTSRARHPFTQLQSVGGMVPVTVSSANTSRALISTKEKERVSTDRNGYKKASVTTDAGNTIACRQALEYLTGVSFFSQLDRLFHADIDGTRYNGSRVNVYNRILRIDGIQTTWQKLSAALPPLEATHLPEYLQQVYVPSEVHSIEIWKGALQKRIAEESQIISQERAIREARERAEREANELAIKKRDEQERKKKVEAEIRKKKEVFNGCKFLDTDTVESIAKLSDSELQERMKTLNEILEKSYFDDVVANEYKRLIAPYASENDIRQETRERRWEMAVNIVLFCLGFSFVAYLIALFKAYAGTIVVFKGWRDYLLSIAFFPLFILIVVIFSLNDFDSPRIIRICLGGVLGMAAIISVFWAIFGGLWIGNRGLNAILTIGARPFTVGLSLFALAKVFDAGKKCYNANKHTRQEITQAMFMFAIFGFVYRFGIKPMIYNERNDPQLKG